MRKYLTKLGDNAKKAFKNIDTKTKNKVLRHFANSIYKNKNKILLENLTDI
jgi:gamma-glutamyl phosphate reductase